MKGRTMKHALAVAVFAALAAAPVAAETLYVVPGTSASGDRYALDVSTINFGTTKSGAAFVLAQFVKIGGDGESETFHLSVLAESCRLKQGRVLLRADDGSAQQMFWSMDGKTMIDFTTAALCGAGVAASDAKPAKPAKGVM
jgi:hypothetical protein